MRKLGEADTKETRRKGKCQETVNTHTHRYIGDNNNFERTHKKITLITRLPRVFVFLPQKTLVWY